MKMIHWGSASPTLHLAVEPGASLRRWQLGNWKREGLPERQTVQKRLSQTPHQPPQGAVQEDRPGEWCISLPQAGGGDICLVSPGPASMIPTGEGNNPLTTPGREENNLPAMQVSRHIPAAGVVGKESGWNKRSGKME